ncbi:hypothetical protein HCJ39_06715 [Listeria rocourtiae]|uniref:hypothetical protein n=1 Tax=Listeria rocourtiae TaxID=647910 RepID=UPI0016287038|nr:hypothetical protein [Listeria rocourtiae]MBC1604402.1 hypothetical protein [Listeria rocourtiae]
MIELALICVFLGLLTFFAKKKSFKKGMSLFLTLSMVAFIIAGCEPTDDELTRDDTPTTTQEKKSPKLVLQAENVFKSDENGTVTISGKTKPDADLTLIASGHPDQVATSDTDGNFAFTLTEVPNDGTAVLTTSWKGQTESKDITYQANPTYKTKLAKIEQEKKGAEAKRVEAEKKEQERIAEAERAEAARVAEEARKAEEKRAADERAAAERDRLAVAEKERAAKEQRKAEQRRQAQEQQPADDQGKMVYITATGKRYHFDQNCRGLNNSNGETQVTLSEAKSRGLTKCKFE